MFSTVIFLLLGAVSGTVSAAPGTAACRVELVPSEPDQAWIAAATALDSELRRSRPSDRDCTRVVVRTNIDRPTVAVFIADGRYAVRALNNADDLGPTVQGMIITISPQGQAASSPEPTSQDGADAVAAVSPPVPQSGTHVLVTAAGGGRLSFPGTLPALVVEASGGMTYHRWELGVFGNFSPAMPAVNSTQNTFELGASVARRHRWGPGDFIVGARAGGIRTSTPAAYQIDCTGNAGPQCTDPTGAPSAQYLPFVGALAGLALWPTSLVRFRPQLLFQWLPTTARSLGGLGAPSSASAPVPGWSLTLSLGAESGAL